MDVLPTDHVVYFARWDLKVIKFLCILAGTPTTLPPMCLYDFADRSDKSKHESCSFEISQDLQVAHLTAQWIEANGYIYYGIVFTACVITWLCTDSPLPDCYIVLLITPKHPTHSNTGTVTVAELSCTHSFPHNDPMHGFGDECVQYYSQPQSCTHV